MTEASPPSGREALATLRSRIEQATELIAQLREANHSLSDELVQLKKELDGDGSEAFGDARPRDNAAREADAPDGPSEASAPDAESIAALQERIDILLAEREKVRDKVRDALGRLESLKS